RMHSSRFWTVAAVALGTAALTAAPQRGQPQPAPPSTFPEAKVAPNPTLDKYKADVSLEVDGMREDIQRMNDTVFSFAEPGVQELETAKYLSDILERNGFKIERGLAGIPTAFMATWGSGKPVIALGSDIDDIPQASQKPGVAWHEPIIEGA